MTKYPMENLMSLKNDMIAKRWHIVAFLFTYKGYKYIVLVHRYKDQKSTPDLALVKLEFMRENDLDDNLISPANRVRLLLEDKKKICDYFHIISYSKNSGDVLQHFYESLGIVIPKSVKDEYLDIEKKAMIKSLSQSDSEDPNKIYCYKVKRNGERGRRSIYNNDKTKLLRPKLHEKLESDPSISFCYSLEESKEKSDAEILQYLAQHQTKD